MHISPISVNTDYKKPRFEAKFPKKELVSLIDETKLYHDADAIPKLYVLLEYLAEFPGKVAELITKKNLTTLKVDNKQVGDSNFFATGFETLKELLVGNYSTKQYIRMPERIFEQKWWDNRNVKGNQLMKFAYSENKSPKRKKPFIPKEIKPYDVNKQVYTTPKGRKDIEISNLNILGLQKTEEGRKELDNMARKMTAAARLRFNATREVIQTELSQRNIKHPDIYKD